MGGRVSCLTHFSCPLFQAFDLRREGQGWGGGMCHSLALGCECTASHVSPRVKQSWGECSENGCAWGLPANKPRGWCQIGWGREGLQEGANAAPDFCS